MKKCGFIILALVLVFSLISCSKKQQALEELQQPMSPEDLNRIKTQSEPLSGANIVATTQGTTAKTDVSTPEPLPPSGPFKPTNKEIQTALKNAGYYSGAIDGKVGPMTKKAIKEFQTANGIQADGKVGPKTWSLLAKYLQMVEAGASAVTTKVGE